jgi:hypothetical protein
VYMPFLVNHRLWQGLLRHKFLIRSHSFSIIIQPCFFPRLHYPGLPLFSDQKCLKLAICICGIVYQSSYRSWWQPHVLSPLSTQAQNENSLINELDRPTSIFETLMKSFLRSTLFLNFYVEVLEKIFCNLSASSLDRGDNIWKRN